MLSFKEFQSLAPLKAKERCPVDRRHKGISKAPDDRVCLLSELVHSKKFVSVHLVVQISICDRSIDHWELLESIIRLNTASCCGVHSRAASIRGRRVIEYIR